MPIAAAIPYIVAAASTYASVSQADAARKQGHAAQDAAKNAQTGSQVDIDALNEQVKSIATQNARDSQALEAQLTPEVPVLRQQANQGVINGLTPDASVTQGRDMLAGSLGSSLNTPLMQAAIARARANLAMGGNLDADTQNAVTRHSLATAGAVGGGGLGLGRDVTARDLGLTSLQLEHQRLQDATQLGGMESSSAQFNATNLLNKIQILRAISDSNYQRQLSAAQYGESIRQPIIGLDPSSIANITIANRNANVAALANQANVNGQQANNSGAGFGQILGALPSIFSMFKGTGNGGTGGPSVPESPIGPD